MTSLRNVKAKPSVSNSSVHKQRSVKDERRYCRVQRRRTAIRLENYATGKSRHKQISCCSDSFNPLLPVRNQAISFVASTRIARTEHHKVEQLYVNVIFLIYIVTCTPIARQRVDKHIPATKAHATIEEHQLLNSESVSTHY
jgi:hypothetical protein